jgi:hypothetical protein
VFRFALSALVLASFCVFASAQEYTPQWELYGGYQYTRIDTHAIQDLFNLEHALDPSVPLVNFGAHQGLNGWNFGGQENTNSWFGGVVDVSGSYGTKYFDTVSAGGISVSLRTRFHSYSFMAGPQFTLRRSPRIQPFGRALFGGAWYSDSSNIVANNVPLLSEIKEHAEGFGLGGGGGVDFSFSSHLGMRVTVDYMRTFFFNDSQGNTRATVGLVYKFGEK